jgi:hypothetical protein
VVKPSVDSHLFHPLAKILAISAVAISDQVARHRVPRESMNDLLGGPFRSGAGCYVEMDVASPIMSQNHEDVQDAKANRGHSEEIHCDKIFDVII